MLNAMSNAGMIPEFRLSEITMKGVFVEQKSYVTGKSVFKHYNICWSYGQTKGGEIAGHQW